MNANMILSLHPCLRLSVWVWLRIWSIISTTSLPGFKSNETKLPISPHPPFNNELFFPPSHPFHQFNSIQAFHPCRKGAHFLFPCFSDRNESIHFLCFNSTHITPLIVVFPSTPHAPSIIPLSLSLIRYPIAISSFWTHLSIFLCPYTPMRCRSRTHFLFPPCHGSVGGSSD